MGRAQSAGRRTAGAGAVPERAGVVPVSCFSSVDESAHYGFSVCMLLSQYRDELGWADDGVAELGTGDATAIAEVVRRLPQLRVHGYDISAASVERARENIAA